MKLKFVIEGISKKLTFSLLTIMQFTIVSIAIYASIQFINEINSSIKSLNNQFGKYKYYKIDDKMVVDDIKVINPNKTNKNLENLQKIKMYFDKNENIEFMSAASDIVFLKKSEAIPETIATYMTYNHNNIDYVRSQGVYINKEFLKKMNYKFSKGGIKEFEAKEKDMIPIIVGSAYKDKYSVGDIIKTITLDNTGKYSSNNMKIVGILDENNYINLDGTLFNKQSLKNSILIPFNYNHMLFKSDNNDVKLTQRVEIMKYIQGGYLIFKNDNDVEKVNDFFMNSGLKFKLKDFNKEVEKYKENYINMLKPEIYVSCLVVIFTIISVIIVMMNSISKNQKEYGINLIVGSTMKEIRNRILGEILFLILISISIATVVLIEFDIFSFNIMNFIITIGIVIGVVVVISTVVTFYFNKNSINDLIRRND